MQFVGSKYGANEVHEKLGFKSNQRQKSLRWFLDSSHLSNSRWAQKNPEPLLVKGYKYLVNQGASKLTQAPPFLKNLNMDHNKWHMSVIGAQENMFEMIATNQK